MPLKDGIYALSKGRFRMQTYNGKSVYGGIAVGKIHIIKKKERQITRRRPKSAEEEIARFEAARAKAKEQLAELWARSERQMPQFLKYTE